MKRCTSIAFIALIVCFSSLDLCAQGIRATVVGRATDQSGSMSRPLKFRRATSAPSTIRDGLPI